MNRLTLQVTKTLPNPYRILFVTYVYGPRKGNQKVDKATCGVPNINLCKKSSTPAEPLKACMLGMCARCVYVRSRLDNFNQLA